MCSVICRVGFEFISLSIQLENISSKPKMNSTGLCKVGLAKLLNQGWKGSGALAGARGVPCSRLFRARVPPNAVAGAAAAATPGLR